MIGGKQLFIFTHDPKIETAAAAATNTMPAADLDSLAVYELEQAIEMAEAFFSPELAKISGCYVYEGDEPDSLVLSLPGAGNILILSRSAADADFFLKKYFIAGAFADFIMYGPQSRFDVAAFDVEQAQGAPEGP